MRHLTAGKPYFFVALAFATLGLAACGREGGADLSRPAGKEWPLVGGDWGNTRYSTLDQINPGNVAKLGAAWFHKWDGERSAGTPVITGGRMFVQTSNSVHALDPKTGTTIWSTKMPAPTYLFGSKGPATGDGMVFAGTNTGRVVAFKQDTGEQVWVGLVGDENVTHGQFIAGGPTYVDGVVITGLANGDYGARGRMAGLDAKTGKKMWEFFTAPRDGDPGRETWPEGDAYGNGGAGVWTMPVVDRELGLVYVGVGNPTPQWGGEIRKGDNLYSDSVIALEIKTGKLKWHYQIVRHDVWEADVATPIILFDSAIDGKQRKAVAAITTNGYLFMLDRKTGEPVWPVEERPVPQSERMFTSPTQRFPVNADPVGIPCIKQENIPASFKALCPYDPIDVDFPNAIYPLMSMRAAPMAYSPDTKRFYTSGGNIVYWMRHMENPRFFGSFSAPGLKSHAHHSALDSTTNKLAWQNEVPPQGQQFGAGFIVTKSGLLFTGHRDGSVEAYDTKAGERLWQFYTGANTGRPAATYEIGGEQHVVISADDGVWAFKLNANAVEARQPLPIAPATSTWAGRIQDTDQVGIAAVIEDVGYEIKRQSYDEYTVLPQRVRIKPGAKLTWTNNGKVPHTPIAQDGSWTAGEIAPGKSASVTFNQAGVYEYAFKEHPFMLGQITVEAE